jgi:hypothetical protein
MALQNHSGYSLQSHGSVLPVTGISSHFMMVSLILLTNIYAMAGFEWT